MSFPSAHRITAYAVMASFALLAAAGCAARNPALVKSKDLIAVTVMPGGPDNWRYTIETRQAEYLTSVEFISPHLEGCKVLAPDEYEIVQEATPEGIKVSLKGSIYGRRFHQFRRLSLVLTSDTPKKQGEIKIRVTDYRGNTTMIEPVAGPVASSRIGTPRYVVERAWRSYEITPQHFGRFPDNLVRIGFIGN